MTNTNKLRGKIVEKGMNVEILAKETGMNRSTFYRKLNSNGENFTIKEADLIIRALQLSCDEAVSIFFSQYVA